jgi:TonB family protein
MLIHARCARLTGVLLLSSGVLQGAAVQRSTESPPVADDRDIVTVGVRGIPPPRRVKDVLPVVPDGITPRGVALLEVVVSANGRVETVKLLRGVRPEQPALNDAALEAAKKWEFEPTVIAGKPRRIKVRSTVNYNR